MTSQNFSSKLGSFDNLKVFTRCGLMSLSDQMRCTELAEMPACHAIERILQRLLPSGGRVASVMTRATFAGAIEALRPRPGSSASPSRPDPAKRVDHMETRLEVVLSRSATRSEEHTSELQSHVNLVCRLLLEKKKKIKTKK